MFFSFPSIFAYLLFFIIIIVTIIIVIKFIGGGGMQVLHYSSQISAEMIILKNTMYIVGLRLHSSFNVKKSISSDSVIIPL